MTKLKRVLVGTALVAATAGLVGCSSANSQQNPYTGPHANSHGVNVSAPNVNGNNMDVLTHAFNGEGIKVKPIGKNILLVPPHAIRFANASAELTPQDQQTLSAMAKVMKAHTVSPFVDQAGYIDSTGSQHYKPQATYMVRLVGHASSPGNMQYNQNLSQRRVQNVAAYLEAHGVQAKRITTDAMGEKSPIASNASRKGQAINRRVDVMLTPAG